MGKRRLFGTDGVRGRANLYPMTGEVAMALGRAVTYYFQTYKPRNKKPLIIVGKDTRLSCYMLEQAFSAGVCSQGGRVILTGPLPTPGVAFVTESMRADAGVVISASHNPYHDNGIKIFDGMGQKLPDNVELELERMVFDQSLIPIQTGEELGNAKRLDEVFGRYIVHTKSAFDQTYGIDGMRVVLDCANGAGYRVAPMIFSELGAEVIPIGVSPNGTNINMSCGALHPESCQAEVIRYRADLGICLDGDADRVVIVDSSGKVIEGDHLIAIFAKLLFDKKILKKGDQVVGTVMSNLGLEHFIESLGGKFVRTQVGDRYIIDQMNSTGALLGGEPSGHIIFRQHATTGDGILAALKAIECMKFYNKSLSTLVKEIHLYPQKIKNVIVKEKPPFESVPAIAEILKIKTEELGKRGRIVLRYSGTEGLARVMVEANDEAVVNAVTEEIASVVYQELGDNS